MPSSKKKDRFFHIPSNGKLRLDHKIDFRKSGEFDEVQFWNYRLSNYVKGGRPRQKDKDEAKERDWGLYTKFKSYIKNHGYLSPFSEQLIKELNEKLGKDGKKARDNFENRVFRKSNKKKGSLIKGNVPVFEEIGTFYEDLNYEIPLFLIIEYSFRFHYQKEDINSYKKAHAEWIIAKAKLFFHKENGQELQKNFTEKTKVLTHKTKEILYKISKEKNHLDFLNKLFFKIQTHSISKIEPARGIDKLMWGLMRSNRLINLNPLLGHFGLLANPAIGSKPLAHLKGIQETLFSLEEESYTPRKDSTQEEIENMNTFHDLLADFKSSEQWKNFISNFATSIERDFAKKDKNIARSIKNFILNKPDKLLFSTFFILSDGEIDLVQGLINLGVITKFNEFQIQDIQKTKDKQKLEWIHFLITAGYSFNLMYMFTSSLILKHKSNEDLWKEFEDEKFKVVNTDDAYIDQFFEIASKWEKLVHNNQETFTSLIKHMKIHLSYLEETAKKAA